MVAAKITTKSIMAQLTALEDPMMRAVNEKLGDAHGVNLGKTPCIGEAD